MENKSKKSKAFIITFIAVLFLLIVGYLIFKNGDKIFHLGTSTDGGGKIFNPLPSDLDNLTLIEYPDSFLKTFPTRRMVAQAGEDLKKGDVVYIDSIGNDGVPVVKKALASDPVKSVVLGVANEDIKAGTSGEITTSGPVIGLNTNRNEGTPWSTSDQLYLSLTTPGGMTKNIADNPNQVFYVGIVAKIGSTDGIVNVGGKGTTTSAWVDFSGSTLKNNINTRMAEAGENLKRGDVVYISGFNASGIPVVKKAIAGDPVKGIVYGVANNSANTGGLVEIIVGGAISGIQANQNDTNPWRIGDQIYLSKSTAGAMTNQLSSSSDSGVLVGVVMKIAGGTYTVNIGGSGTTISSWSSFSANSLGIMVNGGSSGEFGSDSAGGQGAFGSFFSSIGDTLSSAWGLVTMTIGNWANSIFGSGTFGGGTFGGGIFGGGDKVCWNGAINYPKCNIDKEGNCLNGATNPPDCTDGGKEDETCSNGAVNYPDCTINGDGDCVNGASNPPVCNLDKNGNCINGATNPPTCSDGLPDPEDEETPTSVIPQCRDGEDNDKDGKKDAEDPGCHTDDDLSKAWLSDKDSEVDTEKPKPPVLNECQVVYDNQLQFTLEERQKLDDLLRKFYLIAPTLKTEDDIATIYQTYDQKIEFIDRVEKLTKECYLQTNNQTGYKDFCVLGKNSSGKNIYKDVCYVPGNDDQNDPPYVKKDAFVASYTGPTTIYGNPWFKYTDRGTYVTTNQNSNNNLNNFYQVKAEEDIKKGEQVYITGGTVDTMFTVKKFYLGIPNVFISFGTATQDILSGEIGTISSLNYSAVSNIGDLHIGDVNYGYTNSQSEANMKDFEILLNIW